jgi:hypothetical protein
LEHYHFFHNEWWKVSSRFIQWADLKVGIPPFTIKWGTLIDDLVAVYIDIAEWKLHPSVWFLLPLLLVIGGGGIFYVAAWSKRQRRDGQDAAGCQ